MNGGVAYTWEETPITRTFSVVHGQGGRRFRRPSTYTPRRTLLQFISIIKMDQTFEISHKLGRSPKIPSRLFNESLDVDNVLGEEAEKLQKIFVILATLEGLFCSIEK